LEEEIVSTLIKLTAEALDDLPPINSVGRAEWLRRWPAQCVITSSCIHFTRLVEASIGEDLSRVEFTLQEQLREVVSLVRTTQSNIERMMLSALIVLEVHNLDLLRELVAVKVDSSLHFSWISQLRYYLHNRRVDVNIVYTQIDYGYEYIGVGTRLVITPLTDRCYRTMAGALLLNLGGAPEGPAGTGKTESVKDLAKAVATQCIVFNCGDGLNAHAMAKFFKGLASSGAWSCFDEFNRIELEVLSVIA
jgi:dynein heavy chain